MMGSFFVVTEYFYVATELAKTRRNYVATKQFYVAIELARVRRISVAIEYFYVATELAKKESSAAHDKVGRAKAGMHDSVVLCCVATKEAMRARQTWSSMCHRPGQAGAVGKFCHDRLTQ